MHALPGSSRAAPARPRATPALLALALAMLAAACWATPAAAQRQRAWTPPQADSLVAWASQARVAFQSNRGDSVGGDNYRAYDIVSRMGRHILGSLGRGRMNQAHVLESTLDSLGLDTEVELDPDLPYFVFLMVRNPFQVDAPAVGFYYWFRQEELRVQGALFRGGYEPRSRVWWTGDTRHPYTWGVVDRSRSRQTLGLTLLRLSADGNYWDLIQFPGDGLDLGRGGESTWADLNRDGIPELVVWTETPLDSTFVPCTECPKLLTELTFAERREGFRLQDSRLVPTPWSTFTLFIHLLQSGQQEGASRLLADPGILNDLVATHRWNRKGKDRWRFMNAEPGERWPRWIAMRHELDGKRTTWVIRFTQQAGRWVIQSVKASVPAGPGAQAPNATDKGGS